MVVVLFAVEIPSFSEGVDIVLFLSYCSQNYLVLVKKMSHRNVMLFGL